jgi:hypothetical protein
LTVELDEVRYEVMRWIEGEVDDEDDDESEEGKNFPLPFVFM